MTDLSIVQRRALFNNYEKFVAMFGQERVDAFLSALSVSQLTEEYKSPMRDGFGKRCAVRPPYHASAIPIGTTRGYTFTNSGGWEKRDYDCPCETWLVPSRYQGLTHEKLVRPALLEMFPWLGEFPFEVYQLNFYANGNEEFYVGLTQNHRGHKSLYVPYAALFAGDVDAIVKRNEEYLRWYCKTDDVWNEMKADPGTIKFLEHVAGVKK